MKKNRYHRKRCGGWAVWHYRLWSFKSRDTKLERFLQKNQHTQRILLNFVFRINGELSKSDNIWLSKCKNLSNFVPLARNPNNPYCHIVLKYPGNLYFIFSWWLLCDFYKSFEIFDFKWWEVLLILLYENAFF